MGTGSDAADVDSIVTATVRGLAHARHLTAADLSQICGVGKTQMLARLNNRAPWKLSEAARLARHFQISLDDLTSGNVSLAPKTRSDR